jgi:hypothetical protein
MSLSIALGVLDAAVHEEKYAPETETPLFRPERVKKTRSGTKSALTERYSILFLLDL